MWGCKPVTFICSLFPSAGTAPALSGFACCALPHCLTTCPSAGCGERAGGQQAAAVRGCGGGHAAVLPPSGHHSALPHLSSCFIPCRASRDSCCVCVGTTPGSASQAPCALPSPRAHLAELVHSSRVWASAVLSHCAF